MYGTEALRAPRRSRPTRPRPCAGSSVPAPPARSCSPRASRPATARGACALCGPPRRRRRGGRLLVRPDPRERALRSQAPGAPRSRRPRSRARAEARHSPRPRPAPERRRRRESPRHNGPSRACGFAGGARRPGGAGRGRPRSRQPRRGPHSEATVFRNRSRGCPPRAPPRQSSGSRPTPRFLGAPRRGVSRRRGPSSLGARVLGGGVPGPGGAAP